MAGQTQQNSVGELVEESSLSEYRRALSLVERLHRQLLDVVKDDLDRAGHDDLTPVQALLIFNIGDAEWSAGELKSRGFYLGSNVSYNLKKLHELGYVESGKSLHDKRQIRLRLTKEGADLRKQLDVMFQRHAATLSPVGGVESPDLVASNKTLTRLERFWADQIRFRL
ncbi:MarR family winged helix-turn-helix transcriptional regulator [Aquidulcibacter sp.]|uniref:MarR family winged helix-turn-helix transcriptional regulator n=1 Tax=Aquidulcibacter sp. TaxID=2052990 RepID=UPI0025C1985F|nr:MarR family winged helix-turn-helix transcriptional regulator [Aquidulcibacter sp.]MCA3696066.1 MarR family transcriptional regulator [Aquidulcibacter sp.]